jgi:phosphoribosyl-dephospho-CoA transferase
MGISVSADHLVISINSIKHNGTRAQTLKGFQLYLHTLTHIPHPIHNSSEMKAILDAGVTSIQSLPVDIPQKGKNTIYHQKT